MNLSRRCPGCGVRTAIKVNREAFIAWVRGRKTLPEAFPKLSADQLDFIESGWHNDCVERAEMLFDFDLTTEG